MFSWLDVSSLSCPGPWPYLLILAYICVDFRGKPSGESSMHAHICTHKHVKIALVLVPIFWYLSFVLALCAVDRRYVSCKVKNDSWGRGEIVRATYIYFSEGEGTILRRGLGMVRDIQGC